MTKQEDIREGIRDLLVFQLDEGTWPYTNPDWCNTENCKKYQEVCSACVTAQIIKYLHSQDVMLKVGETLEPIIEKPDIP